MLEWTKIGSSVCQSESHVFWSMLQWLFSRLPWCLYYSGIPFSTRSVFYVYVLTFLYVCVFFCSGCSNCPEQANMISHKEKNPTYLEILSSFINYFTQNMYFWNKFYAATVNYWVLKFTRVHEYFVICAFCSLLWYFNPHYSFGDISCLFSAHII